VSTGGRVAEDPAPARFGGRRAGRAAISKRASAPASLLGVVGVLALAGCGSTASSAHPQNNSGTTASAKHNAPRAAAPLRVGASTTLPAPVQLPAVAPAPSGVYSIGGLDAADSSVASVVLIDGSGARDVAKLPLALHDAAAAQVDGRTYLFGGGELEGASESIFEIASSGVRSVGRLPVGTSDITAVTIGHTAYMAGGYTVSAPLRTIVAFTPGGEVKTVAMLPRPLRYAAVAAVGGRLLIAGGTSGTTAERAILSFDPVTNIVHQIGELPQPLTHAAGASLNGWFYVLGGRGENLSEQHSSILAIDPRTGAVRGAGQLPEAVSDIGAASLASLIVAVGGRNSAGTVSGRALTLLPVAR
jgi:hypothetical protein